MNCKIQNHPIMENESDSIAEIFRSEHSNFTYCGYHQILKKYC
jgi:hypothetical protein